MKIEKLSPVRYGIKIENESGLGWCATALERFKIMGEGITPQVINGRMGWTHTFPSREELVEFLLPLYKGGEELLNFTPGDIIPTGYRVPQGERPLHKAVEWAKAQVEASAPLYA